MPISVKYVVDRFDMVRPEILKPCHVGTFFNGLLKYVLWAFICYCAAGAVSASAMSITIDPDAYAPGTNLSTISPYVTLATSQGTPVYSAPMFPLTISGGYTADKPTEMTTTGPLGAQVFSQAPNGNTEWISECYYGLSAPGALVISFTQPVTYVSLLRAEVFPDAGSVFDDPNYWLITNSSGEIIDRGEHLFEPIAYNGSASWGDPALGNSTMEPAFPVYFDEYSGQDISRIIIFGDSEPTTLDRLTFTPAPAPVPEPATLLLLLSGLAGLAILSRSKRTI